jgi:hypothetical protein
MALSIRFVELRSAITANGRSYPATVGSIIDIFGECALVDRKKDDSEQVPNMPLYLTDARPRGLGQ